MIRALPDVVSGKSKKLPADEISAVSCSAVLCSCLATVSMPPQEDNSTNITANTQYNTRKRPVAVMENGKYCGAFISG